MLSLIALFLSFNALAQQKTVSGQITDSDATPLPGVNVVVQGTNQGVASDFDGNYQIQANVGDVIVFSFIGFETQESVVGESDTVNVSLVADYANLDEVVITGYGTTRKKELVSSISQIAGDELTNQPAVSVDNILQGRAAGVLVTSNSGEPGAPATINIRGTSSIGGNNKPL